MPKEEEIFLKEAPDYNNSAEVMFIHSNLFQKLEFPKTYPALIQVHLEHPAMEVPLHWHPGAEIIYSRNKRIRIVIDGEKIDVKPGEFVLISSFALHAVEPEPDTVHQDVMSVTFQSRYLEQFGYTREYFCRIFKEYSNLTFKNYLTSLRLSAAVQEIVMSDRGIGQIAMEYGFSDEKSFFGAFKKKYGMTPAQYRQTKGKM